jgi:acylphosphatase
VSANTRIEATVHGRVQGVGFRWFVQRRADSLGLVGWVANDSAGSVRVVAEGPAQAIHEFESALRAGPPGAAVDRVDASKSDAVGEFSRFQIRAGGHSGN